MIGYGMAYFRWTRSMMYAGFWPFYDNCPACQHRCRDEWEQMHREDEVQS